MADRSVVSGRVIETSNGSGIAGLRIEALDVSGTFRDLLGYAVTDADGRFRMEVLAADIAPFVGPRGAVAYLRVIHEPSSGVYDLLADTRESGPKCPLDGRNTDVTLRVDTGRILVRLPSLLPFVVTGTVRATSGPIEGVSVQLNERDLASGDPVPVGDPVLTDARGHYRISYSPGDDGAPRAVLLTAATSPETVTEVRCHAPPSLVVDIVRTGEVYRGLSTYDRTTERLASVGLMSGYGTLTDEQCERLACSLGLPVADVTALRTAHHIKDQFGLPFESSFEKVAFAVLGRGVGTDRDSFFRHPPSVVRKALLEAKAANAVSAGGTSSLETVMEDWARAAADWALEPRPSSGPCGLGELLDVAEVSDAFGFAKQLCANELPMPEFWDGLTGTFDKPRIQLTLQWWSLARGHLPLIQALEARRVATTETTLEDLAKFSEAEWLDILDTTGAPLSIPPGIEGPESERKANYARLLYRTMATAFPTATFRHRAAANGAELPGIQSFLGNPTLAFEFGKKRLSHPDYLTAFGALSFEEKKRFKAIERVFRFAPTYEEVNALVTAGYDSAHAVHTVGQAKFITDMQAAADMQVSAAKAIFTKACWQVRAASAVYAQIGDGKNKIPLKAFANFGELSPTLSTDVPDWQTLFGNAGGCACKHCAGVLGPAAYLSDLLVWLRGYDSTVEKNSTTHAKWSAFDVLVGVDSEATGINKPAGRRPDLQLLELTCKSAHTPQPYIDLVNELLELAVAKEAEIDFELLDSIKTGYEPEELAAGPEILYEVPHLGAWRSLMTRRHPFTLPVCLFDREAEAYLRYLGVSRADIVETLGGSADDLAKARLGVRDDDEDPPGDPPLLSGWKMLIGDDSGTASQHWGGKTYATLSGVRMFLRYSGLTFTELEELLATRYVNGTAGDGLPALSLAALTLDPPAGCDVDAMQIVGLTDPHLLRLHRFLRLRLHTGLSSTDLDLLLAAFSSDPDNIQIDAPILQKITGAQALAAELDLPVREVAGFFADLDVHERWEKKSPYRQYFLNRLVDSPEPAAFLEVFTTPGATAHLDQHTTALQQGLGITAKELLLLVNGPTLESDLLLPASEELVLEDFDTALAVHASVSKLWRHVRLARALGLTLADYLVLRAHSGTGPIGPSVSPETTKTFVDLVRTWKSQKLSVADLQWVLRGFAPSPNTSVPDAADVEALRAEIAGAVATIESETESAEDLADSGASSASSETRVLALLDELVTPSERDELIEALRRSAPPASEVNWSVRIEPIGDYLPGTLDAAKLLLTGLYDAGPPGTQGPPQIESASERFAYVARWLDRHIRGSRAVLEKIAAATALPIATVTHLMTAVIPSGAAPSSFALLSDFLPPNKPGASTAQQAAGLALVLRHARLVKALGVGEPIPPAPDGTTPEDPGELLWVYDEPTLLAALPLALVPQTPADFGSDDRVRFEAIVQLTRRMGLRDRMKGGKHALRELLTAAPPALADAQSLLAEKTGWNKDAIITLCPRFSIDTTASLLTETSLLKLEKAIALIDRLGVPHDHVLAFATLETPPPPVATNGLQPTTTDPKNARDLVIFARHAAKAKLSAAEWRDVAQKIRDPFREVLRDRLVDALVPSDAFPTRDDLYGFHLIDVEMCPCMMTSRIVQATNAVQVFVQRAFLGLDAQVKLPTEATRQWEWRKAYRVWEANRKVFLWPENWLEPDLRDDMTPLFKDFLTNLASGEITDATAEKALEKYLSGLHEIARLEPMGLWYDSEFKTDHVIARTRSQPRKWFYRRRERNMYWTPWEKMDVDIDAESLLLVGANRRLYLFWPQLTVKNDRPAPTNPGVQGAPPHPGPPPLPQLGEDWDHWAGRLNTYQAEVEDWAAKTDNQAPVESEVAEEEPPQHYEVRVAWSSYLDGAWTQKRLSDCPPLIVPEARGERATGYEPKHIVFSLDFTWNDPPPDGFVRLKCLATPWLLHIPVEHPRQIGTFTFDACDGGRWTSMDVPGEASFWQSPSGTQVSNLGFEELLGEGYVEIKRTPPSGIGSKLIRLMDKHEGHFFIQSPSSYEFSPPHAFERFVYADYKAIFHARAASSAAPWTAPDQMVTGQVASPELSPRDNPSPDLVLQWAMNKTIDLPVESSERYVLDIFEHPYACEFANRLAAHGVSNLLGWTGDRLDSAQYLGDSLESLYEPTDKVAGPFPKHDVTFELDSAYGMYNWELFFHVPFTIAQRLSQEGRYAEAQKWYHHIFNPTSGVAEAGPKRFWFVKPFHDIEDLATIGEDLASLASASSFGATLQALVDENAATQKAADEMLAQITAMAENPFSPHVLARMRPLAYMKNVFMRYVQNLLDWADSLFRRDTMESIHEALTLYLLAADLLGPRPDILDHKADPVGKTFKQLLQGGVDAFGNAAVEVETIVSKHPPPGWECTDDGPPMPDFRLYFCIPPNDQMYGLWDTVADRLFKIRNCMNIEGVARSLPLFAPPIDPAILVRAFAAGVRLDQVLDALAAPAPLYRFVRLHAKAVEFAGAVQSLGQAVLAALEKKDGEELALLRQRHEITVLDAEREIRKQAIQEARNTLAGLERSRQSAETRFQHYTALLDKGLLPQEKDAASRTKSAKSLRSAAADAELIGTIAGAIPDILTSPMPGATLGGRAVQLAASAVGRRISADADALNTDASLAQTTAGYARRTEDWKLQKSLSQKEMAQLDKQVAAQEIRLAIAERELENLDTRREHSREVDAFYRSKFTSQELYTWMAAQLAGEHYRAYQTAYDMAKRAERAYQLERGDDTSFIRFGAWDSLKKGLLAGERLLQDLRALDAAYLSRSDREREITKHISLAEIAGDQLTALRDGGSAEFELHPYHFDADYPGHYFRRIKTVALTVATVKAAADGVQCELTLLKSAYRKTSQVNTTTLPYPGDPYVDSAAYRFTHAPVKALVTSTAENDPGLFELSLKDEMLLPAEGSGAVSNWRVDIDPKTNRFPMHRISDVVLHLRYTAKDAGKPLRDKALAYAEGSSGFQHRTRVFSARRDFDEAWSRFIAGMLLPADPPDPAKWVNRLELRFAQSQFQSFFGNPKVRIVGVQVSATFHGKQLTAPTGTVSYTLIEPNGTEHSDSLEFRAGEPSTPHSSLSVAVLRDDDESFDPWLFQIDATSSTPSQLRLDATGNYLLKPDAFEDIWFIVTYEKQVP